MLKGVETGNSRILTLHCDWHHRAEPSLTSKHTVFYKWFNSEKSSQHFKINLPFVISKYCLNKYNIYVNIPDSVIRKSSLVCWLKSRLRKHLVKESHTREATLIHRLKSSSAQTWVNKCQSFQYYWDMLIKSRDRLAVDYRAQGSALVRVLSMHRSHRWAFVRFVCVF